MSNEITDKHREFLKELLSSNSVGEGDDNTYLQIIAKHFPEPMNEEMAIGILGDILEKCDELKNSSGEINWQRFFVLQIIQTDGNVPAEQLEAVAWWMRNKNKGAK